jgi:hypothetical protein
MRFNYSLIIECSIIIVNAKRKLSLRRRKPEAISGKDCFAEFTLSNANVLAMMIICYLI